jgi:hypothetical protein
MTRFPSPFPAALVLLLAAPTSALLRAREPGRWGLGGGVVYNAATAGSTSGDLGSGVGLEGTWRVRRGPRSEWRLRLGVTWLGEGRGGHDAQVPEVAPPISWDYRSQGLMESLSIDWIRRLRGPLGPYLIAGVGISSIQERQRLDTTTPAEGGGWKTVRTTTSEDDGGITFPTLGLGWTFAGDLEGELRVAGECLPLGERFGPKQAPVKGGFVTWSLMVHRRF